MSQLQAAVSRLQDLLTPPVGYAYAAKIFPPEDDDLSAQANFKRDLFSRSLAILESGSTTLADQSPSALREIGERDFDQIEELLATDPEQRDFFKLANAAAAVVDAIRRAAASGC